MKKFLKYSNYLYFVVAILSLIAYFTKKDMDNNFWLVLLQSLKIKYKVYNPSCS